MNTTIFAHVNKPVQTVWDAFNLPKHIMNWNHASDTWYCPAAKNDLRVGGNFVYRMAAKDGSFAFDFEGTYDQVKPLEFTAYTMPDNRKVNVTFKQQKDHTYVEMTFDLEEENSMEDQRSGWQSILDNFKAYTEKL